MFTINLDNPAWTHQQLWVYEVADTLPAEVNLLTYRLYSPLALITWDFPVAGDKKYEIHRCHRHCNQSYAPTLTPTAVFMKPKVISTFSCDLKKCNYPFLRACNVTTHNKTHKAEI